MGEGVVEGKVGCKGGGCGGVQRRGGCEDRGGGVCGKRWCGPPLVEHRTQLALCSQRSLSFILAAGD